MITAVVLSGALSEPIVSFCLSRGNRRRLYLHIETLGRPAPLAIAFPQEIEISVYLFHEIAGGQKFYPVFLSQP